MRASLHILTRANDDFARQIIKLGDGTESIAEVVDLTVPEPDYESLLEKIFAADPVVTW